MPTRFVAVRDAFLVGYDGPRHFEVQPVRSPRDRLKLVAGSRRFERASGSGRLSDDVRVLQD